MVAPVAADMTIKNLLGRARKSTRTGTEVLIYMGFVKLRWHIRDMCPDMPSDMGATPGQKPQVSLLVLCQSELSKCELHVAATKKKGTAALRPAVPESAPCQESITA